MPIFTPLDLVENLARVLRDGGTALLPTDTVVGLAAHPAHPKAVNRVFALKSRPATRNLPVMIADRTQLPLLGVVVTPAMQALLDSPLMPGALSIVARICAPPPWATGRSELAFRIPDDAFLQEVLRRTGPLFVTSANRHGAATPGNTVDAAAQLTAHVDYTVPGTGAGNEASTLLDCTNCPARILRQGAMSPAQLRRYVDLRDD